MRNDRIGRRRFGAAWIGAPLAMLLAVSCPYPEMGDHFDDQDSMGNGWRYGGVQWTPDGERIIVSSSYLGAYVSRSDGASVEEIGERVWIADMSPDGSRVAYSTKGKTGACGFEWWEYKIETSKLDGSARRSLRTDKESGLIGSPVWSPDGSHVAFVRYNNRRGVQVFTMPADGSDVSSVWSPIAYSQLFGKPVWSPDGTRLAFAVKQEFPGRESARPWERYTSIYVATVGYPDPKRVFRSSNHRKGPLILTHGIVWAPHSEDIAFLLSDSTSPALYPALYRMNYDGSGLFEVPQTREAFREPGFQGPLNVSPDGSRFAVARRGGAVCSSAIWTGLTFDRSGPDITSPGPPTDQGLRWQARVRELSFTRWPWTVRTCGSWCGGMKKA